MVNLLMKMKTGYKITIACILGSVILMYFPVKFAKKEMTDGWTYCYNTNYQYYNVHPHSKPLYISRFQDDICLDLVSFEVEERLPHLGLAHNVFALKGHLGHPKGKFLGDEDIYIFHVTNWDIMYPIDRGDKGILLPKAYLSIMDYLPIVCLPGRCQ